MKVFDLQCHLQHSFEGWFGSEDDFQGQLARGLIQCPMCESTQVSKKLSAPRLNLKSSKAAVLDAVSSSSLNATDSIASGAVNMPAISQKELRNSGLTESRRSDPRQPHPWHALMRNPEFQQAWMEMAKKVLAQTEDVGEDFAREARKIHYGETPQRGIRGQASKDEVIELLDEGIDVMPLPLPAALKGTLH